MEILTLSDMGEFRHRAYTVRSLKDLYLRAENQAQSLAWRSVLEALDDDVLATGLCFQYESRADTGYTAMHDLFWGDPGPHFKIQMCGKTFVPEKGYKKIAQSTLMGVYHDLIDFLIPKGEERDLFKRTWEQACRGNVTEMQRKDLFLELDPAMESESTMSIEGIDNLHTGLWHLLCEKGHKQALWSARRVIRILGFPQQQVTAYLSHAFQKECVKAWRNPDGY